MATFQLASPTSFNFARPEEWPKWLKRFERFKHASGLAYFIPRTGLDWTGLDWTGLDS